MFGICNLSVIPVRKEPKDSSEQVTQLVFGECFEIISTDEQWKKIRMLWDNYEGWIDEKTFLPIAAAEVEQIRSSSAFSLEMVGIAQGSSASIPIVMGSSLPFFQGFGFKLGKQKFNFQGQVSERGGVQDRHGQFIERVAMRYLNAPYQWGGRSPFGIDCSGLSQMVYKVLGIQIPRDASQQVHIGSQVHFLSEASTGDLAFFENSEGNIAHVGIMLGQDKIMHAFGKVRIDMIDHQGIYNIDTKKYSHTLRVIKRML